VVAVEASRGEAAATARCLGKMENDRTRITSRNATQMTPAVLRATAFKRTRRRESASRATQQQNGAREKTRRAVSCWVDAPGQAAVFTGQQRRRRRRLGILHHWSDGGGKETKTSGRRGTNQNNPNGRTTFFFLRYNSAQSTIDLLMLFQDAGNLNRYLLLALEKFHFKKLGEKGIVHYTPKKLQCYKMLFAINKWHINDIWN